MKRLLIALMLVPFFATPSRALHIPGATKCLCLVGLSGVVKPKNGKSCEQVCNVKPKKTAWEITDVSASRRLHRHGAHHRRAGLHRGRYAIRGGRTDRAYYAMAVAGYGTDPRPHAWCGWYARHHLVSRDPGRDFNLARNWARWGRPAQPGVGVMVVWPHHVGKITGRDSNGNWIVLSGNDGHHQVMERPRSIRGAIAFRSG